MDSEHNGLVGKESNNNMINNNETSERSDCQMHIGESVKRFRTALGRYREGLSDSEMNDIDMEVCLTSRSAYFDFYSWMVMHEVVDDAAVQELTPLFERAVNEMGEGTFKDSVKERFEEFKSTCKKARDGKGSWVVTPVSQ